MSPTQDFLAGNELL